MSVASKHSASGSQNSTKQAQLHSISFDGGGSGTGLLLFEQEEDAFALASAEQFGTWSKRHVSPVVFVHGSTDVQTLHTKGSSVSQGISFHVPAAVYISVQSSSFPWCWFGSPSSQFE